MADYWRKLDFPRVAKNSKVNIDSCCLNNTTANCTAMLSASCWHLDKFEQA